MSEKILKPWPLLLAMFLAGAFAFAGGSEGGQPLPPQHHPTPPCCHPHPPIPPPQDFSVMGRVISIAPCDFYVPSPTEHDPQWQCAVISEPTPGQGPNFINVVFAASEDVVWAQLPKLQVGYAGQFWLTRSEIADHLVVTKFYPAPQSEPLYCSGVPAACMVNTTPRCCPLGIPGHASWMCVTNNTCPQVP